jgi:glucosylceramidase
MQLSPAEEALFASQFLRPALHRAGLDRVRLYGFDYTWLSSEPYVSALLTAGGDAFDGIAYHCYFGAPESMSALHALFPEKDVIEDECSTGIAVLSPIQVLLRSVRNWASTVLMWNVALDPSGGPKMGSGCFSCVGLLTVDPGKGTVSYGGGFYQLGQASSFVRRGARVIASSDAQQPPACGNAPVCGLEYAAFRNRDRSVVVVASNSGTQPVTFAVRRPDGRALTYTLPGQQPPDGTDNTRDASVVTFRWRR